MILKSKKFLDLLFTIFFILLFSLIPWVEFINANLEEIDEILNENFYILIIIYFFFITILYLILKFLDRKRDSVYYITFLSFSIWVFFQYNILKFFFNSIFEGYFLWHFSSEISLSLIIIVIIASNYFLKKIVFLKIFTAFFMIFNLIYYGFSLYPKLKSIKIDYKIENFENNFQENYSSKRKPNLYFFLFDAMKPLNEFEDFYKINLDTFKTDYQKYGYKYLNDTSNSYIWTDEILTSFFYLETNIYQDDKNSNDNFKPNIIKTFPTVLKNEYTPKFITQLSKNGYNFKWVGNYMSNCSKTNYNYCLKNKKKDYIDIYTLQSFLNKSPIIQILDKFTKINFISKLINFKTLHSDPIFEITRYLTLNKDFISTGAPHFFFIHDLETHDPYFVNSDCENNRYVGKYNLEGYKNSYLCNIKKISKIIKTLDEYDPEALVFFQSDHNWIMSLKSEREYGKRTNIFNLFKNKTKCKVEIPDNFNTLNLALYISACLKEL